MSVIKPHTIRVAAAIVGALVVAAAAAGIASAATSATMAIPIGQTQTGKATYSNDAGYGACGTQIDAATQDLVAVSYTWWTSANPNNDPLCQGISVEVTYNGKTITVPVRDKCPGCTAEHLDLSQTVFQQFAPLSVGVINGLTWKFVNGSGGGGGTTGYTVVGPGGKCVDVAGDDTGGNGAAVQLWDCQSGAVDQHWVLSGGAVKTLGRCLDVTGGSTAGGAPLQLWDCNGGGAQQWVTQADGSIRNPASGRCVDSPNGATANGTRLQTCDCNGTSAQKLTKT